MTAAAGGVVGKSWLTVLWDLARQIIYSTPASMQPEALESFAQAIDPTVLEAWIAGLDYEAPVTVPVQGTGMAPRIKGTLAPVTCDRYVVAVGKGATVTKIPCKKKTCHACGPRNAAATRAAALAYIRWRVEQGWTCAVMQTPTCPAELAAWNRGLRRWVDEQDSTREHLSITPRPGLTTTILLYEQESDRPGYGKRQSSPLTKAAEDGVVKGANWMMPCSAIFEHYRAGAWEDKVGSMVTGIERIRSAVASVTYRLLGVRQEDAKCKEGGTRPILANTTMDGVAAAAGQILQASVHEADVFLNVNSGTSTGKLTAVPPALQRALRGQPLRPGVAGGHFDDVIAVEEALRSDAMLEALRAVLPSVGRRQRSDDAVLDEINGKTERKPGKGRKKAPKVPEVDLMDVLADT